MNRLTVLQKIIDRLNAKTYLEIGVQTGSIISKINAPDKIGVDPEFIFSKRLRLKRLAGITKFKTIETASDDFFEIHASKLLPNGVDVALVDGFHTYVQSLRDVENCLNYLNSGGVIVMHDCNPLNYASAYPVKDSINEVIKLADNGELAGWNGTWNGDVWKTIAHIRIQNPNLNVFTLDLDWGLGIISRKGNSTPLTEFTVEEIQKADYSFLEQHRDALLNLKHPRYLNEFLQHL